jgi:hypothetical protein
MIAKHVIMYIMRSDFNCEWSNAIKQKYILPHINSEYCKLNLALTSTNLQLGTQRVAINVLAAPV